MIFIKSPVPLTQTDIATLLKRTKNNVNPIVKSLVAKGILAVSKQVFKVIIREQMCIL